MRNVTMDLPSVTTVTPVDFNAGTKTQGSTLTVDDPQTDKEYTCRVIQADAVEADTTVDLNVYSTYLNCLNHLQR